MSGTADYTIRPFVTTEEYHECVALQEATWGVGFSERVSPAILKVSQILGGVSAGAYDDAGTLVGFVFGLTGVRGGEVVHWSDMLAVRPEARDAGLGRHLKEYQREEVLSRGIEKMYWTFDPLQARNAHLNLNRLGAVVREYAENMYGETDSPLHRGIGTDRFIALWLLSSRRVRAKLGVGSAVPSAADEVAADQREAPHALRAIEGHPHPAPGDPDLGLTAPELRVAVPTHIGSIMTADLDLAVRWRHATRPVFRHYLSGGYEVAALERGPTASTYVLRTPIDETR